MGGAALLAIPAAVWWFWWVPSWRPPLRDGERYGIDVSAHQGEVDWEAVASDGIGFAYLKATEGGDFVDRRFADNWPPPTTRASTAAPITSSRCAPPATCRPATSSR